MNAAEVTKLIELAKSYWPHSFKLLSAPEMVATARGWLTLMPDVPFEGAVAVLLELARDGTEFAPGPGKIVRMYHDRVDAEAGNAPPGVDECWDELMGPKGVNQPGGWYSGPPEWSHPAVAAIASAIGWDELCHGDVMVVRAHVIRLYPATVERVERNKRNARTDKALGFGHLFKPLPPGTPELQ